MDSRGYSIDQGYSLDDLEIRFKEHAERYRQLCEEQEMKRVEEGWKKPDYDHLFSLPQAFITIVEEIKKLKERQ